jgi:hypothetical protein
MGLAEDGDIYSLYSSLFRQVTVEKRTKTNKKQASTQTHNRVTNKIPVHIPVDEQDTC